MSNFRLSLLGTPVLERDGESLHLRSRKNVALLAYLAVTSLDAGGTQHTREALVTLLWPELEPSRARAGLRRNLSLLRKVLGGEWLVVEGETISLDPGADAWLDVAEFRRLTGTRQTHDHAAGDFCPQCLAAMADAVGLYRGDFLAGFSLRDSPTFDEWQFFQTEGLRLDLASALEGLVRGHGALREYEAAIPYARRWVALDPLHEPAHRRLMRLYHWTGQRAAALRQYSECERVLSEELGVPPDRETVELYDRIKTKRGLDRPPEPVTAAQTLDGTARERALPSDSEATPRPRLGRSHMVGRRYEMGTARAMWDRARTRQGGTLLISGEAGIGKTRLVGELVKWVQASGGRWLMGACYADSGSPYAPFKQIIRDMFGDVALAEGGVDLGLPRLVLRDLVALAPELEARFPDDLPAGSSLATQAERQRLFDNLALTFTWWSEHNPLLLVLEDVQWADSGTLALFRHLARRTRRQALLIVATFREVGPDQARLLHEVLLDLDRERLATRLRLRRLEREQTREMLGALFAEEITSEFLEGIYRETEGNPFFVEEVCKSLVDSGQLEYWVGRWHRPTMKELGIPQSVQVAIQSRVRVLPANAQQTLLLAAVLGREFQLDTLAIASEQAEVALVDALESAVSAQLVLETGQAGGGSFAFVHNLIPATLVDSTGARQRRDLHRRAATALEARRPHDFEALAHHYSRAGQVGPAVTYLLRAGDRARALYAHHEAIGYYQRALENLHKQAERSDAAEPYLERAARTLMKLGLTHQSAFDFDSARRAFQEGFVLWQQPAEAEQDSLPTPPHPLRVTANEPFSLDSCLTYDVPSMIAIEQLFCGLVEKRPDMGVVPDVAQSWQVLDGGRRYVFHLRDDVFWSDGVPVTAGDFEYAWKRVLDPGDGSPYASMLYDVRGARAYHQGELAGPGGIGVRAQDERTLCVELEEPTSHFLHVLAVLDFFPVPRHAVQTYGLAWAEPEKIVSNGPFRVVSWEPGEGMLLERYEAYHGRSRGNVQQVALRFVAGQPARALHMYETDALDICGDLPPSEMDLARQRQAGDYVAGPRLYLEFVAFDASRPPFDDRRVRRALALATDRDTLADVVLAGYSFPATGGLLPPGMPGHSPGIGLPYEPETARKLLAEAGFPGGCRFPPIDCWVTEDPALELVCEHLAAQWLETLGLHIAWQQIESVRFEAEMSVGPPHLWLVGWWVDYPDPENFLRNEWWARLKWREEEHERLVEGARRVQDQQERIRMYQQADRILIESAAVIPLLYGRFHLLVKPWVSKYPSSPLKWWFWKDVVLEPH